MKLSQLSKFFFSQAKSNVLKTALYDYHQNVLQAKIIEFAGYLMPVNYKEGVLKEHLWCRNSSSVFDVSHMGQVKIYGKDRMDFVEMIVTGDIRNKPKGETLLNLILNENAGIIDDCMVTNLEDHIHFVVNGANKFIDLKHMNKIKEQYFANKDVEIVYQEQRSLIAIQGPKTAEVIQSLTDTDLSKVFFLNMLPIKIKPLDLDVGICRCGYTGEDGFEISADSDKIEKLADLIFKNPLVKPAGLGARDSLRVEAGLCLHGHDMNDKMNPLECNLMWLVRKFNSANQVNKFYGREALTRIKRQGISQKRVGFMVQGSGILRSECELQNEKGEKAGYISSGTFSPCVKKGLGMCFVKPEYQKIGTKLFGLLRGKKHEIAITKPIFVETNYYKPQ